MGDPTRAQVLRGAALFSLAPLGAGCASKAAEPAKHVGMVTDVGGLGDKSFNDSAYNGLLLAKQYLNIATNVLQSRSAADYQPNLTTFAEGACDQTFAIGFLMSKDLGEVAGRFAKRRFAIVDAIVERPNITSITFREQDASFLAGAVAAMVTKTKKVAFLGGLDVPLLRKFEAGYSAGVRQVDPGVQVAVKYVGSFEDVAAGKELAAVLFDQGADIVYAAAGKSGLGAINEVKARDAKFVIGVDSNQDALAPGKVLTSVLKRVDVAVYRTIKATLEGNAPPHIEMTLAEAGVDLTDFKYSRPIVGEFTFVRLRDLRAAITSGKIVPPQTREELARFKPARV